MDEFSKAKVAPYQDRPPIAQSIDPERLRDLIIDALHNAPVDRLVYAEVTRLVRNRIRRELLDLTWTHGDR